MYLFNVLQKAPSVSPVFTLFLYPIETLKNTHAHTRTHTHTHTHTHYAETGRSRETLQKVSVGLSFKFIEFPEMLSLLLRKVGVWKQL